MAVDTQVFPVGAVSRVVHVVPVFVMHGQKMPVLWFELSAAFGADKTVNLKRTLPVVADGNRKVLPQLPDYLFNGLVFAGLFPAIVFCACSRTYSP